MEPVSLIIGGVSSLIGAFGASKQRSQARAQMRTAEQKLASLEANRQEIINPYEGIKDLSSMITNPFANLQVATKAAEMQAQQSDISLASTLDTLRAGGVGSSGATALAQAALQSKQGIAASIEQQEARNAELRAKGEQQMQQIKMQEAARLQQADVAGKGFVFSATENRQMQQINRAQAQLENAQAAATAASNARSSALGGLFGSVAGAAFGAATGAFSTNTGMNSLTADTFDRIGKFVGQQKP